VKYLLSATGLSYTDLFLITFFFTVKRAVTLLLLGKVTVVADSLPIKLSINESALMDWVSMLTEDHISAALADF